jgi:hypothetical protein
MKRILYSGLALGLLLAAAPMALADIYSFSYVYSGNGITLSGNLTTDASVVRHTDRRLFRAA